MKMSVFSTTTIVCSIKRMRKSRETEELYPIYRINLKIRAGKRNKLARKSISFKLNLLKETSILTRKIMHSRKKIDHYLNSLNP
jgi:hypothetical protein